MVHVVRWGGSNRWSRAAIFVSEVTLFLNSDCALIDANGGVGEERYTARGGINI